MKRFLIFSTLFVLASTSLLSAESRRPNFLFIITDDQRWDTLGVVQKEQGEKARFPWLKTPNLDRLAQEGVRLRNAFVTNALCAPSRASFLTGRYNHLNGIANNKTPFPAENKTYASLLKDAGYATGLFGKWHMDGQQERPGFTEFASYVGQGTFYKTPFLVNGQRVVTQDGEWVDDASTNYAIDFVTRRKAEPFVAVVAFKSVHGPRNPDEQSKALYTGERVFPPTNSEPGAPYRAAGQNRRVNDSTPENLLNYFRCLAGVDRNVGRLLDTLDQLGLAENTVVVFASDNGYFLGEHGLGDKRAAYEESIRIPFLVRAPGFAKKGKTVDATVLNIDLAPTFLDLAGAPIPPETQGRSIRPLLAGDPPADWRKSFLYEYFFEASQPRTPSIVAVRTENAKLVTYPSHPEWTELFDLANDSGETKNLATLPEGKALREKLEAALEEQKKATGYVLPTYADPDTFSADGNDAPARPGRNRNNRRNAPEKQETVD